MSYQSTILADNPIRYYRLGEASGTVATDIGSQAQNGTLHGTITLGQAGLLVGDSDTAMLFDGTTGFIDAATTGLPSGAGAWSLECWINFNNFTDYPAALFFGSAGTNTGAILWVSGANSTINIGFTSAGNLQGSVLALNTTYHLVATYDGVTLNLYVNGVAQTPVTTTGAVVLSSCSIGIAPSSAEFAAGIIDEAAFYNYVLTSTQVSTHYTAGTTAPAPVLLKPRYVPRALGATIIPDRVSQPLAYVRRALGSTLIYEARTFIPRALGGIYIPDTVMWVPRALVGTEQIALLRSLTLAGAGTLTGTFSLATQLSDTLPGVGTLTGTLSANTALATTIPGVGTLTGTLAEATALTVTLAGVGTLSGTFSLATALATTLAGVGTLSGTLSANTALSDTLAGVGTLNGTLSLATALTTTLAGVGTLNGTLSTTTNANLAVTMAGVGTLAGTMALSTVLVSTLSGVGTLTGAFSLRTALSLAFAGAGTLMPNLGVRGLTIQFLTATWVTRDLQATWTTRDEQAAWDTRDDLATWKAR